MTENSNSHCDEEELDLWSAGKEAAQIAEALRGDAFALPGERSIADKVITTRSSARGAVIELKARLRKWRWATVLASAACVALAAILVHQAGQPPKSGGLVEENGPARVKVPGEMSSRLSKTREKITALSSRPKFWNARTPGHSRSRKTNKPRNSS